MINNSREVHDAIRLTPPPMGELASRVRPHRKISATQISVTEKEHEVIFNSLGAKVLNDTGLLMQADLQPDNRFRVRLAPVGGARKTPQEGRELLQQLLTEAGYFPEETS